jgi:hypothetical protein
MPLALFNRHDPWWEVDGPAARRERRHQRFVSLAAFITALAAVSGAAYAWAFHLGLAAGFALRLPTG